MGDKLRGWVMRHLTGAMVLGFVLMAGSAQAVEWSYVGETDPGDASFVQYIDRETIRRNGNTARAWTLRDYARPQTKSYATYSSSLNLDEYDCTEQRARDLQISVFSGNMASGGVVNSADYNTEEWSYVAPGTIGESLMEAACGR